MMPWTPFWLRMSRRTARSKRSCGSGSSPTWFARWWAWSTATNTSGARRRPGSRCRRAPSAATGACRSPTATATPASRAVLTRASALGREFDPVQRAVAEARGVDLTLAVFAERTDRHPCPRLLRARPRPIRIARERPQPTGALVGVQVHALQRWQCRAAIDKAADHRAVAAAVLVLSDRGHERRQVAAARVVAVVALGHVPTEVQTTGERGR